MVVFGDHIRALWLDPESLEAEAASIAVASLLNQIRESLTPKK